MYYIGVDLGTSAVKLVLMQGDGTIKNVISKSYELYFPHPGWSEQKPEDWWESIQRILHLRDLPHRRFYGSEKMNRRISQKSANLCFQKIISHTN